MSRDLFMQELTMPRVSFFGVFLREIFFYKEDTGLLFFFSLQFFDRV